MTGNEPASPIFLRRAKPADAEAIGRIRVSAWRKAYREYMPAEYLANLDAAANLGALRAALESPQPPFVATVAEIEDEVIAFSIVGVPRYQTVPDSLELWALNVEPGYWRLGIGKALVEAVSPLATQSAASRVELWCIKGNAPASRLYETCGFVRTGAERTTSALTGYPLHEAAYAKAIEPGFGLPTPR